MRGRPAATAALQLDLFGEVLAAEQQRRADALRCLRDSVPTALEVVAELQYGGERDDRSPSLSGKWAYCVSRAGLRYEARDSWGDGARERGETWGWSRTPAQLVTWAELTVLFGDDPRRVEIARWADSLPMPRWRELGRPHELYPDAEGFHVSHFCREHLDKHWSGRLRCWGLVYDLLNDALDRVTNEGADQ